MQFDIDNVKFEFWGSVNRSEGTLNSFVYPLLIVIGPKVFVIAGGLAS